MMITMMMTMMIVIMIMIMITTMTTMTMMTTMNNKGINKYAAHCSRSKNDNSGDKDNAEMIDTGQP